jgi:hypothetical protein
LDIKKIKPKHIFLIRVLRWFTYTIVAGFLLLIILFMVTSKFPSLGANGAEILRNVIGDQAVAGLEMVVFQGQDVFEQWKYKLGILDPTEAWVAIPSPSVRSTSTFLPLKTPLLLEYPTTNKTSTIQPSPTPTLPWQPVSLTPINREQGEGLWYPYIYDAQGDAVAYKTFVQPDAGRPYTRVSIVAFNLTHTRLHYVLGSYEPSLPGTPLRTGTMAESDKVPNFLLAEFNGGFQARHGQFGAMADGVQALPPKDGLGTIVIYQNAQVLLGEWGTDLHLSPGIAAFRQNGPLVITKGEINQRIYSNSPKDWGYTVNDVSPTIRSGLGLSSDGKTLFYFCGPSLTMEALAKSMQAAGAYNAIQLDINNYWVLFVKITRSGPKLVAEPLLPRLMVDGVDRYLHQSPRDFFYITGMENK